MREDVKMRRCERRCEDERMRYRPPLLEEPCAQTLSGIKTGLLGDTVCGQGLQRRSLHVEAVDMAEISADPGRCKGERVREEDGRKGVPFPPVT